MSDPLIPLADRIALREDEAAAMLGISETELGRLRRDGKIPRIAGMGRVVLYSPLALRRWALEQSGYADPGEVDDGQDQDADALRNGQPGPARGRAVLRGRPRTRKAPPAPVRLFPGGGRG